MNKIIRIMRLEILEVITIGFPFCIFKLIYGIYLLEQNSQLSFIFGILLISLAFADFLTNFANFLSLLFTKRRVVPACLMSLILGFISKRTKYPFHLMVDLGNALDLFLSFIIVAVAVGSGVIPTFAPIMLNMWNGCVVFNVLGAGLNRLAAALYSFSKAANRTVKE